MPDAFGIALANKVSLRAIHKRRYLLLLGKESNIEGKLMIDSTWKSVNKQEGGFKKFKQKRMTLFMDGPLLYVVAPVT